MVDVTHSILLNGKSPGNTEKSIFLQFQDLDSGLSFTSEDLLRHSLCFWLFIRNSFSANTRFLVLSVSVF